MTKAQLTVLAGPTAVGKGTVVAALTKRYPTLNVSVSATTRDPRPGELNGVHYYFVSAQEFDAMIERGDMLEWALVHGKNKYGTPRGPVDEALAAGKPVLLEIDLAGARGGQGSVLGHEHDDNALDVGLFAVVTRIGLENGLLAAIPLHKPVAPRAYGVGAVVGAIGVLGHDAHVGKRV